jgi:hypothetical protein
MPHGAPEKGHCPAAGLTEGNRVPTVKHALKECELCHDVSNSAAAIDAAAVGPAPQLTVKLEPAALGAIASSAAQLTAVWMYMDVHCIVLWMSCVVQG